MFDRLDRNEHTFRDTGLEEAVRSAIIQMNKMADDYLRDYLTARGITLATPEHDAKVATRALREAAEALDDMQTPDNAEHRRVLLDPAMWLTERADRIEREAIEGDA